MWQATRYMSTDEPVPDQSEDQVPKTGIETADRKPERQIHRLTAKIGPASESAQVKMCLTPLETSGNG